MKCPQFEAWLDEGRHPAGAPAAGGHAESCPACRRALDAAIAVDHHLEKAPPPASPGFTDRVMNRIEETPPLLRHRGPRIRPAETPWWIDAWAEPAAALALIAGSLLAWRWETVLEGVARGSRSAQAAAGGAMETASRIAGQVHDPLAVTTLTLMLAGAVSWASLHLYRSAERWMTVSSGRAPGSPRPAAGSGAR